MIKAQAVMMAGLKALADRYLYDNYKKSTILSCLANGDA
jgi:hypothetical protein